MKQTVRITLVCVAALAFLSACASKPPLYQWGAYEDLIYDMYAKPGKAEPGVQIVKLTEDIERAHAEGKRVPPGVHAHLGYMYYTQGNAAAAAQEFATERELFPEAGTFIDGMLARMKKD